MDPYQLPEDRDSDNPYAPPQSSPAPALATGMPFTVNDVFQWSWSIFTERMRACLSIFWGVVGINLAISIVLNLVQESMAAGVRDPNAFKVLYILSSVRQCCPPGLAEHRHDPGHAQDRTRRAGDV